ncbi:hypothetical protein [Methylobacterium sp. A54F]
MSTARKTSPAPAKASLRERAVHARDAAGRFIKRASAEQVAEQSPSLGTVRGPAGAHPGAYGLRVDEHGLGLHAAPSSCVIVEPVMPEGAGLAVFYFKDAAGPVIFDLTHSFIPAFAQPFAPGSEVVPLIEVVQARTGRVGMLSADRIEKLHRIIGVYTPTEVALKHRPAPAPLPLMAECPDGMGEQEARTALAYPLVRPGETVVYDPGRRDPIPGALCVLEWNNGTRSILQTNRRAVGSGGESWWVDPINRPTSAAMLDRRLRQGLEGGMLYTSDGPYQEDHLREKIVGTVIGILVPRRAIVGAAR